MDVQKLYRDLRAKGVPESRTPLFENALFGVWTDRPDLVVGKDADGDDVTAASLLEAFEMNASDYETGE